MTGQGPVGTAQITVYDQLYGLAQMNSANSAFSYQLTVSSFSPKSGGVGGINNYQKQLIFMNEKR